MRTLKAPIHTFSKQFTRCVLALLVPLSVVGCNAAKKDAEHIVGLVQGDLEKLGEIDARVREAVSASGFGQENADNDKAFERLGNLAVAAIPACEDAKRIAGDLLDRLGEDKYEYGGDNAKADVGGLVAALRDLKQPLDIPPGLDCTRASLMQTAPCVATCRRGLERVGVAARLVAMDVKEGGGELRLGALKDQPEPAASK